MVARLSALGVAAFVLVCDVPDLGALRVAVTTPAGVDDLVAPLAGAVLWGLALWVVVAVSAGAAARLPGAVGRVGRRVTVTVVPRVLRGAVLGSLAGGLVLTPAVAATAAPPPSPGPTVGAAAAAPAPPAWPTDPAPPAAAAPAPSAAAAPPAAVTVRPGDCLWTIAADALARDTGRPPSAAQVAVAWPRWWAVNRGVVGDDPDLVRPGAVLRSPGTDPATGQPS